MRWRVVGGLEMGGFVCDLDFMDQAGTVGEPGTGSGESSAEKSGLSLPKPEERFELPRSRVKAGSGGSRDSRSSARDSRRICRIHSEVSRSEYA